MCHNSLPSYLFYSTIFMTKPYLCKCVELYNTTTGTVAVGCVDFNENTNNFMKSKTARC